MGKIDDLAETTQLDPKALCLLCLGYSTQGGGLTQADCSKLSEHLGTPLAKKVIHQLFTTIKFTKETDFSSFFMGEEAPSVTRDLFLIRHKEELKPYLHLLKQDNSSSEMLLEASKTAYKSPLERVEYDSTSYVKKRLVCLSDWHIGMFFSLDGKVMYDQFIAKRRISEFLARVRDLEEHDPSDELIVLILGDMADGALPIMRPNQALEQSLLGQEQLRTTAELISMFLLGLKHPKMINVISVAGNHDRIGAGRDDDEQRLSMFFIMNMVKAALSPFNERFKVIPAEQSVIYQYITPNIRLIVNHGDKRLNPSDLIQYDACNPCKYRIIIEGHVHNRSYMEGTGYCKITSPSIVGESSHSYNFLAKKSLAGQMIVDVMERDTMNGLQVEVNPIYINLE